jgi:hypothetical protein
MSDFDEFRSAAREAVELMGHTPVMAEQFGARPYSSETACINEVQQSDAYLLILGSRYGYETEGGLSVTHAEYRAARDTNRPILAFVQDTDMEPKQLAFREEVEQYLNGVFRAGFSAPSGLKDQVIRSLRHLETMEQAVSEDEFRQRMDKAEKALIGFHDDHPLLVCAFLPQPERLVDIVSLEDDIDQIFATACSAGITQLRDGYEVLADGNWTGLKSARVRLGYGANGLTVLLANPTAENDSLFSGHFAPPDDIERVAKGFFQLINQKSGYAQVALRNMGNCYVAPIPNGSSLSMKMFGSDEITEFSRLFVPLTIGAYEEWIDLCVRRFGRIFRYEVN